MSYCALVINHKNVGVFNTGNWDDNFSNLLKTGKFSDSLLMRDAFSPQNMVFKQRRRLLSSEGLSRSGSLYTDRIKKMNKISEFKVKISNLKAKTCSNIRFLEEDYKVYEGEAMVSVEDDIQIKIGSLHKGKEQINIEVIIRKLIANFYEDDFRILLRVTEENL